MPLVINPNDRSKVVDRTDSLIQIPNTVGITNILGLFTPTFSSQKTVEITRTKRGSTLLEDRNWDERNQTIAGRQRDSLLLKIPHFPADDAITPNDIDGIVSANSMAEAAELESVANVRADKMFDLREAHGLTLEAARMQLITAGTVYAPNGTVSTNYYTEFGITREEIGVDLAGATDPRADFAAAKKAVRAGLTGGQAGTIRRFVVLDFHHFVAMTLPLELVSVPSGVPFLFSAKKISGIHFVPLTSAIRFRHHLNFRRFDRLNIYFNHNFNFRTIDPNTTNVRTFFFSVDSQRNFLCKKKLRT